MSLLISTEQITEHLIWPFSTSTFKPGNSRVFGPLPSAKLYAFPFPPLRLWKISGKKTLSINRIEIKLMKLVSANLPTSYVLQPLTGYKRVKSFILLRWWEKYECFPPIQLKVLSVQSKQMRIRLVGSRSRGPGMQQSFSPAVSPGKCFVVFFSCKAPEMWGLYIYFSANGLNGLLRTLNGCVSSMQLQLYQQNCLFICLFTLNYMYFGH